MAKKSPQVRPVSLDHLISIARQFSSPGGLDLIQRAYEVAQTLDRGRSNGLGITYLQYGLEVGRLMATLRQDCDAIAATVGYYGLAAGDAPVNAVRTRLGPKIAGLVTDLQALDELEWGWPTLPNDRSDQVRSATIHKIFMLALHRDPNDDISEGSGSQFQGRHKQRENLTRLLMAQPADRRAVVIRLADHLHCLEVLNKGSRVGSGSADPTLLAQLTLAVYARIAERLGIGRLKADLEDAAFQLAYPQQFAKISSQLKSGRDRREVELARIIRLVKETLEREGLHALVRGRVKHLYSLYRKIQAKQLTLDQINDLLGVRVIVNTELDCYYAQALLYTRWEPLTDYYGGEACRDWIANPKDNLYQSLHTTVEVDGSIVEIQIRTHEMHAIAEYGPAAASWEYKEESAYTAGKVRPYRKGEENKKGNQWLKRLATVRKGLPGADRESTIGLQLIDLFSEVSDPGDTADNTKAGQ